MRAESGTKKGGGSEPGMMLRTEQPCGVLMDHLTEMQNSFRTVLTRSLRDESQYPPFRFSMAKAYPGDRYDHGHRL